MWPQRTTNEDPTVHTSPRRRITDATELADDALGLGDAPEPRPEQPWREEQRQHERARGGPERHWRHPEPQSGVGLVVYETGRAFFKQLQLNGLLFLHTTKLRLQSANVLACSLSTAAGGAGGASAPKKGGESTFKKARIVFYMHQPIEWLSLRISSTSS